MFSKHLTTTKKLAKVLNVTKRHHGKASDYPLTVIGLRGYDTANNEEKNYVDTNSLILPLYDPKVECKSSEDIPQAEFDINTRVQTTRLSNGVTVLSTDSYYKGSAVVSLFVKAGSRHENFNNGGASHFVQRFLYGPTNQRSYLRVVHEMQKTGADVSSQAGREEIVYRTESVRDAIPHLWSVIANSLLQTRLLDHDMQPKREAVKLDLELYANSPELILNEALHSAAFGGKTLGRSLFCPSYNLNTIKASQILQYMNQFYRPDRMTLVATNISHQDIVSLASDLFGDVDEGASVSQDNAVYVGGDLHVGEVKGEDTHTALAFKGVSQGDKDFYVYQVLASVLGDCTNTHIYKSSFSGYGILKPVAELSNIIQAKAFNTSYSDNGLFGVYIRATDSIDQAVNQVIGLIKQVASGIDSAALNAAKKKTLLQFSQSLENGVGLNEFIAKNHTSSISEHVQAINNVTAEQVKNVAATLLKSRPTLASVGNLSSVPTTHDLKI